MKLKRGEIKKEREQLTLSPRLWENIEWVEIYYEIIVDWMIGTSVTNGQGLSWAW